MEKTEAIIVGAGPSGLALALSLAKFAVKSVILEKDSEISEDPRGVFLTHQAVRVLWDLGLGADLKHIGHDIECINFHKSSFKTKPWYIMDARNDFAHQTVQNGIFQMQPRLEAAMRKKVGESPYCDLRSGCEVTEREQSDGGVVVTYKTRNGTVGSLEGAWLVGADGKRGIVRKNFLEKTGIKQVESVYKYEGTWIASNLKINLPTPATHPDFPLWKLGYSPEKTYDLFWPRCFHFCCPPGKPTASGRFGPHEERLWRHEFAQDDWDDSMDAEKLLWEQLTPMITRSGDERYKAFPCGDVTFPRDCIRVNRCRPFRFTHKVVNGWFDNRTILVGDAAHVFPPFGGQGIACGMADSHELAWRLFLLQRLPTVGRTLSDGILNTWTSERKIGVKAAAIMTKFNGQLCNVGDTFGFWFFRNMAWLSRLISFVPTIPHPFTGAEQKGYRSVADGFFLSKFGGGGRVAQIYVESREHSPMLSDELLRLRPTVLTLLAIVRDTTDVAQLVHHAKAALDGVRAPPAIVSSNSLRVFSPTGPVDTEDIDVFFPAAREHLGSRFIQESYKPSTYVERFAPTTKYALIRNDFYIFAQASSLDELVTCIWESHRRVLKASFLEEPS
ncbi:hypothetical protein DL766_000987 [Monosporascus sp. MC13-8B]|nr:hypothetical protein DL766_000987 [Monosporascus sp. MC13-8B]